MIGGTNAESIRLNFEVVGGTAAPSIPRENTIWVNTEAAVSGWEFSDNTPAAPAEGMVWIVTGPVGAVTVNALKAGGMTFCALRPVTVKQYLSGAWEDKTGRIYQGGGWNEFWNGVLYDYGEQYEYITGGWEGLQIVAGSTASGGKLTVNDDNLSWTNVGGGSFGVATENAINFSGFRTLHVLTSGSVAIRCASEYPTSNPVAYVTGLSGTQTEHTLDISEVEGSYKVAINNRSDGTCRLYRAWMT